MSDLSLTRLWIMRGAFILLSLVILFFHLLPLDTVPRGWAGPDLLLCFAFAWSIRRPEYVPAVALAGAFLLADLLLQRPPGLWALLALIACENMKVRARTLRVSNFFAEWITVSALILAIAVGYRLVLAIVLVDVPALMLTASGVVLTVICYPVVVAFTHSLMGVRKSAPGELDALGQRI
ncbi:MAG: rod shape-determining protein MreD [Pseudomonadota bacterium]